MYRIIFLDIDGTLTDSSKQISERTKKSLITAAENGLILCIASGRPEPGVGYCAKELELDINGGYILPFNGGIIKQPSTGRIIHQNVLSLDAVKDAYKVAKHFGLNIITYKDDQIITEDEPNEYTMLESRINNMPVKRVDDFLAEIDNEPVKCLITGDPEAAALAESMARELMNGKANVFRSESFFVEIMPNGIDKAKAIETLINALGISRQEVIACGDGFNDVSMISYAGLGVAMKNGCEPAKKAADYVTERTNDEDGIAEVIERFVFHG